MTSLPSPRPVRLAQHICRIAGVAYLMVGVAVIGVLLFAPGVGKSISGGEDLWSIKDGVLTSTTLWWDGILNPVFHGTVFFVLASALGYVADLVEALQDRDDDAEEAREADEAHDFDVEMARKPEASKPIEIGDEIPSLTQDDLQPLK